MPYFADLTPYKHFEHEPGLPVVNVGWLSKLYPFPQGETSAEFKHRLRQFCLDEHIVRICRGYHQCEFCNVSGAEWFAKANERFGPMFHWAGIGDGEIRVIGYRIIYAAPALILHYVEAHQYQPPPAFIEAVVNGPPPGSPEHQLILTLLRMKE
jgi:hypothetical protein